MLDTEIEGAGTNVGEITDDPIPENMTNAAEQVFEAKPAEPLFEPEPETIPEPTPEAEAVHETTPEPIPEAKAVHEPTPEPVPETEAVHEPTPEPVNTASAAAPEQTERVDGEYHYKSGYTQRIYADAHYAPADESAVPPRYYTPPARPAKESREKRRPGRKDF